MKTNYIAIAARATACVFAATSLLHADDKQQKDKLEKAKNTEINIRQAEPPKVSTTTTRTAASISAQENNAERVRQKETSARYQLDRGSVPSPVVSTSTTTAVSTSTSTAKAPATSSVNTSTSTAKAPATTAVTTSTSTAKAPDKPKK